MNVETFFKKNLKYITIILLALFLIKSSQSCNRNMANKRLTKENTYLVDSLTTMHTSEKGVYLLQLQNCSDKVKELEYEVKLANAEIVAANRRADAVQSTAEKVRDHTTKTIKIEKSKQVSDLLAKYEPDSV